jgi:hypothetical protein
MQLPLKIPKLMNLQLKNNNLKQIDFRKIHCESLKIINCEKNQL